MLPENKVISSWALMKAEKDRLSGGKLRNHNLLYGQEEDNVGPYHKCAIDRITVCWSNQLIIELSEKEHHNCEAEQRPNRNTHLHTCTLKYKKERDLQNKQVLQNEAKKLPSN